MGYASNAGNERVTPANAQVIRRERPRIPSEWSSQYVGASMRPRTSPAGASSWKISAPRSIEDAKDNADNIVGECRGKTRIGTTNETTTL